MRCVWGGGYEYENNLKLNPSQSDTIMFAIRNGCIAAQHHHSLDEGVEAHRLRYRGWNPCHRRPREPLGLLLLPTVYEVSTRYT